MKNNNIVYGLRPIMEAVQAGKEIDKVLFQKGLKGEGFHNVFTLIKEQNIPYQFVPIEKLNKITRSNHQGMIAYISAVEYADIYTVLPTVFEQGKTPLFVLLDRITDVRNVGAIVRTAECAGVDAVIIPSRGGAQLNEDALKTSAGALNIVPVCRHDNLKDVLQYLKESGVQIVAASEKASENYFVPDYTLPTCIVMGNEYDGISPEYLRFCDRKVRIPLLGRIESLNVSVSCGVMLYEVVKQRL